MRVILTCLMVLLAANPFFSQRTQQIEQLLNAYEKAGLFSGSVLIAEKGKIIFEKSYGYRNAPKKEKNTNNSLYRIFSTTKMFTAAVILKLEEEGKLSINDKLSKYYPAYPKGDSITIANILSHTSGIPSEENSNYTVDEGTFIQYISAKPLDFSPGKQWNYSNSGYYILGYIIKKVTGLEYDKAIENYILKPVQMTHSGFHFNAVTDENKALGYEFVSENMSNEAFRFKTDHPFAAGAMYSTVGDLFKFNEALKNYKILKKETLEKMFTPYLNDHYGLGAQVSNILGKKATGHDGGGPGYRSRYYRILKDDLCFILMTNSELSHAEFFIPKIESILYNQPFNIPSIAKVPEKDLKKLEGIYTSGDTNFYITIADGYLIFNGKNYGRGALLSLSSTRFQLDEKFSLTFKPNESGQIESFVVQFRDGTVKTAKRKTDNLPNPWAIIGDATPSGWDGKDILLQTDPKHPGIYSLKNYKLNKGKFKFRMDNDWGTCLGLNDDGMSIARDAYDFHVKEEGIYDIVLDMRNTVKPQYSIKKVGQ